MQTFNVAFYNKQNPFCPMTEFLDSLDDKMRAKILRAKKYRTEYFSRKEQKNE